MTEELKPCPCGKVPTKLTLHGYADGHSHQKWAYVSGDCCGYWEMEVKTNYKGMPEAYDIAVKWWNEAPRNTRIEDKTDGMD